MLNKNIFIILLSSLLFSACGSKQEINGPVHTNSFDELVLDKINDSSSKVLYKKETIMFKNDKYIKSGVFVLTKKAVYLLTWNLKKEEYVLDYSIKINKILFPRDIYMVFNELYSTKVLKITDINADLYIFKLAEATKVVKIIDDLLDKL